MTNGKNSDWSNPYQSMFELYLLAPCLSLECKKPRVFDYYPSRDIRSTLNVPFNLKWIVIEIVAIDPYRPVDFDC